MVFLPQVQIGQGPANIFVNLALCFVIREVGKLLIQIVRVNSNGLVYFKEFDPELTSELIWNALVDDCVAYLVSLTLRQSPLLVKHLEPVFVAKQIGVHVAIVVSKVASLAELFC